MKTTELVASNLDDAREQAAAQLGVAADQIDLEVLEETKGLFGRPGKLTVRATAKDSGSSDEPKEAKPAKTAKPKAEKPEKPVTAEKAEKEEKPAKAAPKARAKKSEEAAPEAVSEETAAKGKTKSEDDRPDVAATQEDADKMADYLRAILEHGEMDAEVKVTEVQGRYINLQVDGADVGYLIGRRGDVLNALQYLLNVIAARQLQNGVRVVLEGDDYRERRAAALMKMAREVAEQVLERQEEAVLDPLPAFERRIIHQALSEIEGVATYSEGEEPERYVVVGPAE